MLVIWLQYSHANWGLFIEKNTFLELFLIAFKMFLIRVEKILWNLPLQFSKCFVQNLYLKTYSMYTLSHIITQFCLFMM